MALEFYVEQADRSPQSGVVDEIITAGELISDAGTGVSKLVFADGGENAGLARYDGTAFARDYADDARQPQYEPDDPQRERAQYQPFEDSAVVKIRTPEDNGTDPAPAIGHKTTVGIVDASALQGSADEYEGRIVEEGYDDGTTTFNRSNSNFKAVGVAYRPAKQAADSVTTYDTPTRVVLFSELKE
jgi:hypothetical protein